MPMYSLIAACLPILFIGAGGQGVHNMPSPSIRGAYMNPRFHLVGPTDRITLMPANAIPAWSGNVARRKTVVLGGGMQLNTTLSTMWLIEGIPRCWGLSGGYLYVHSYHDSNPTREHMIFNISSEREEHYELVASLDDRAVTPSIGESCILMNNTWVVTGGFCDRKVWSVAEYDNSIVGEDSLLCDEYVYNSVLFKTGAYTVSNSTPWGRAHSALFMELREGVILRAGGAPNLTSDLWITEDLGRSWSLLSVAPWTPRYSFDMKRVHDGKILLVGGSTRYTSLFHSMDESFTGAYLTNEVWFSEDGAISWERFAEVSPWAPRAAPTIISLSNRWTIMGGAVSSLFHTFDMWSYCPVGTWSPLMSTAPIISMLNGVGPWFDHLSHRESLYLDWRPMCVGCPRGKYGGGGWALTADSCSNCPRGMDSPTGSTNSSQCVVCPVGTFSSAEGTPCTPCPLGRFSTVEGAFECERCPRGKTTLVTGSTSCSECPEGHFCDGQTGEGEASPCPSGTFSHCPAAGSADTCQACPGGSSSHPGALWVGDCRPCRAGTYLDASTTECSPCPSGTYSSMSGLSSPDQCEPCPRGTIPSSNSSSCVTCPAGTFQPDEGGSVCHPCGSGTVASFRGAAQCQVCIPGSVPGEGREECTPCLPGHTSSSGDDECLPCDEGTFSPDEGTPSCLKCPPGTNSSSKGTVECGACPPGTYSPSQGASECTPCPRNTFNPSEGAASLASCVRCDPGSVSSPGSTSCSPCPPGQTTSNSSVSGECVPCAEGTYSLEGRCFPCPPGTESPVKGASREEECSACPAGSYSASGASTCTPCSEGLYSPVPGASSSRACLECPQGTFSNSSGASQCVPCPRGTFSESTGLVDASQCTPCPVGTYERAGVCIDCPAGTEGVSAGLHSAGQCRKCLPGTYSTQGSHSCSPCPAGSYSDRTGAASEAQCISCPAGTWSGVAAANSSESCVGCPAGTRGHVQGLTSPSQCLGCPAGTYSPEGSSQCVPCPRGRWSSSPNATSLSACSVCGRGTYGDEEGAASPEQACRPCPRGTEGRRLGLEGQAMCETCSPGTVSPEEGAASCQPCPSGMFAFNSTTCRTCPHWAVLSADGSRCEEECPSGQIPSPDSRMCQPCPIGSMRDPSDAGLCAPCPEGAFSPSRGSDSCSECEVGSFSDRAGSGQCTVCPEGRTTLEKGSASERACVCNAGTIEEYAGGECDTCPRGADCSRVGMPPRVMPGYWHDMGSESGPAFRAGRGASLVPCIPEESCRGGELLRSNVTWRCFLDMADRGREGAGEAREDPIPPPSCPLWATSLSQVVVPAAEEQCSEGHAGDRCSTCQQGYYKRGGGPCRRCSGTFGMTVVVMCAALLAFCLAAYAVSKLDISIAPLTITVDFFQIIGRQASIRTPWGAATGETLRWSSLMDFNIEFAPPECVVQVDYRFKWAAINLIPLAALCALALYHAWGKWSACGGRLQRPARSPLFTPDHAQASCRPEDGQRGIVMSPLNRVDVLADAPARRSGSDPQGAIPAPVSSPSVDARECSTPPASQYRRIARRVSTSTMSTARKIQLSIRTSERGARQFLSQSFLMCQLLYMVLVVKSMEALNCRQLPGGKSVLVASPDIVCWKQGGDHSFLATGGVAAVLIYVIGVPLLFGISLRLAGRESKREKVRSGGSTFWRQATAPLSDRFVRKSRSWVMILMIRKAAIASVVLMQSTRPIVQLTGTFAILSTSLALQMRYRPYKPLRGRAKEGGKEGGSRLFSDPNFMEESTLVSAMIVVGSGMIFMASELSSVEGIPMAGWALSALDVLCMTSGVAGVLYISLVTVLSTTRSSNSGKRPSVDLTAPDGITPPKGMSIALKKTGDVRV